MHAASAVHRVAAVYDQNEERQTVCVIGGQAS